MKSLTLGALRLVCPASPVDTLEVFVAPLLEVFEEIEANTDIRQAAFLAQYAHETGGFRWLEEKLRYTTVEALMAATKPRWDPLDADEAWGYLNQPERLANRIYASRMGNGDEASGDGWMFRGRGLPHLTGRENYEKAGEALNLDLIDSPDQLLSAAPACRVGGWFWQANGLNDLADRNDIKGITRRLNGGLNGLPERAALYQLARAALD